MLLIPCLLTLLVGLGFAFATRPARADDIPSLAAYGPLVDFAPWQEVEGRTPAGATGVERRDTAIRDRREGTSAITVSGGFTLGPDTTLAAFELDHFVTDRIAVGPLLQVGLSSDDFIFAPSLDVKLYADVVGVDFRGVAPFVQGGVGFAYIDKNGRGSGREDVGFLFNFGAGADLFVTDRLSLGTSVLFNVLPGEVEGEEFFFSWQLVTFSIHF